MSDYEHLPVTADKEIADTLLTALGNHSFVIRKANAVFNIKVDTSWKLRLLQKAEVSTFPGIKGISGRKAGGLKDKRDFGQDRYHLRR